MNLGRLVLYIVILVTFFTVGFVFFKLFYQTTAENPSQQLLKNIETTNDKIQKVELPQPTKAALAELNSAIVKAQSSSKSSCFVSYGQFPNLDKTAITMRQASDGTSILTVSHNKIEANDYLKKYSLAPCVVASQSPTKNFVNYITNQGFKEPLYRPVTSLQVSYQEGIIAGGVNKINFGTGAIDLNDNGFLFKPTSRHICFLPTPDDDTDCEASDEGISTGCFNQIYQKITQGALQQC